MASLRSRRRPAIAPLGVARAHLSHLSRRRGHFTTWTALIIPLSSWKRTWRCITNFPVKSVKRVRQVNDPSGAVGWVRALVFEAEDLVRAADFWQGLLGVELIDRRDDWIQLSRDRGGIYLAFLPAQGGRLASVDRDPEGEHRVMADTEGNEFTILGPLPRDEAERIGLV